MNDPTVDMTDDQLAAHYADMDLEDQAAKARLDAPDALARAARWYASKGVAVFPLRPGSKAPLFEKAHPHDERQECAGPAARTATGCTTRRPTSTASCLVDGTPQANIGLRTGLLFDVIDVDGPLGHAKLVRPRRPRRLPGGCSDSSHCPGMTGASDAGPAGVLALALTRGDNGGQHLYVRRPATATAPTSCPASTTAGPAATSSPRHHDAASAGTAGTSR